MFLFVAIFAGLLVVGLKVFYPLHMVVGLGIYLIAFILLIRWIYLSRKILKSYRAYEFAGNFLKKDKYLILIAIALYVLTLSIIWLRPIEDNPFKNYTDEQIKTQVVDDLYKSSVAMDYLETSGNLLLTALENKDENANNTAHISDLYDDFIRAVSYSEDLTEAHKYFGSIPYRLWQERVTSFLIAYSLYVKKYEIVHRMMTSVSGNEYQKKVLNQQMPYAERGNIYSEMVERFYAPKTRLRLSAGQLYLRIFAKPDSNQIGSYEVLYSKARESYKYLFSNFFSTVLRTGEVVLDGTEQRMFSVWFPIQKNVAYTMGKVILTTRGKKGFITKEQAITMSNVMQPGDLMFTRRNWRLSNVGIPGFWTHAALYTGDLAKLDKYFASEFPFEGHANFSEYLETNFPKIYEEYIKKDAGGYYPAVVEAMEPGVILHSIPTSADADFVAVLRGKNLNKRDKLLSIIRAFSHVGKPYDFNFDFDTRDSIVCSELVYDALYEFLPSKKGVHFVASLVSGRKIVSPLDMTKKFLAEHGSDKSELEFVYFLRGDEDKLTAAASTEAEFKNSISWSKFTFLQN